MPTVVNALGEHCECAQLGLNFDIWLEVTRFLQIWDERIARVIYSSIPLQILIFFKTEDNSF